MTHDDNTGSPSSMKKEAIRAGLSCAAIIVAGLAFWNIRILLTAPRVVGLLTVDLYQQFLPWYRYTASSLRNLSLPLWFPNVGAGIPWLASPSTAVLYPPNLLYLICPAPLSMGILAQFHLVLAGVGTYAFCRVLRLGRPASLLAGIAYMLCNSTFINYVNPHYLAGVAWLPIVFCLGEILRHQPSIRNALLLTVVMSMQFLSGAGQYFLYTTYLLLLYMALRMIPRSGAGDTMVTRVRVSGLLLLSMALVVLVCSAQLLPALELLHRSVRANGLSVEDVHFPGVLYPWWQAFPGVYDSHSTCFFNRLGYRGTPLLFLLVLYAFMNYRDHRVQTLTVVTLVSLTLCTGYATPLYRVFALLPGIAQSRLPNRISVVSGFALASLAGIGLQRFLDRSRDTEIRKRTMELAKFAGIGGILGLLLLVAPTDGNIFFPIAGFLLLAVGILLRPHIWKSTVAIVICILLGTEFGLQAQITSSHPQAVPDYLSPGEKELLDRLPGIVGNNRILIEERGLPPKPFSTYMAAVRGVSSVADYHPAALSRMNDIIEAIIGGRPMYPDGRIQLTSEAARPDLLSMLSVKFLLLHESDNIVDMAKPGSPMSEFGTVLRTLFSYKGYRFVENTKSLPRAYIANIASVERDRYAALRSVLNRSFDPAKGVVLEGEEARRLLPLLSIEHSRDSVKFISRTPRNVALDVDSEKGGILVLTDTYYPGWVATLDGSPVDIYRANYLFRAAYVPPGNHFLEFTYRPKTFYAGVCLSTLGTAALAMGLVLTFRRPRCKDSSPTAD